LACSDAFNKLMNQRASAIDGRGTFAAIRRSPTENVALRWPWQFAASGQTDPGYGTHPTRIVAERRLNISPGRERPSVPRGMARPDELAAPKLLNRFHRPAVGLACQETTNLG
jgi:hypothetical protein